MIQGRREMIDGVYIGAQLAVPELEGGNVLIRIDCISCFLLEG